MGFTFSLDNVSVEISGIHSSFLAAPDCLIILCNICIISFLQILRAIMLKQGFVTTALYSFQCNDCSREGTPFYAEPLAWRPFWRVLSAPSSPTNTKAVEQSSSGGKGRIPGKHTLPPTPRNWPPHCAWVLPATCFDMLSIHPFACVGFLIILNHISQNSFWHAVTQHRCS